MTKQELVCSVIQKLGYNPSIDEDGDVIFRYQMKGVYVMVGDNDDKYLTVVLPQFYEIEEGEDALVLAVCNKLTRDIKMAKVYVDHTYKHIASSCEFYYTDEEALAQNITHSLRILGMVRTAFRKAKGELSE